jgi:hypothetical protein
VFQDFGVFLNEYTDAILGGIPYLELVKIIHAAHREFNAVILIDNGSGFRSFILRMIVHLSLPVFSTCKNHLAIFYRPGKTALPFFFKG